MNTQRIVNTRGDYCEAYVPVKYVANSVQSTAVSTLRSIDRNSPAKPLTRLIALPIPFFCEHGNPDLFSRFRRIYLRCCQWLN
ncbi:hypothetical protein [Spirosoma fluviale]|uniref:hypothetical protein n=1 Tax=Spirosoma fluviale TaxID=1597977 RepID=UPI001181984E|nr:hypothetical protein [Spirosoma fluviale]